MTTYEMAVTYSGLGPDQRLNYQGVIRILQEAAAIASDDCGYGLKDIPRTGLCWILAGWRLELHTRPGWRAPLTVQTWPRCMKGFLSERDFLLFSGRTLVARATSRWLLLNTATGHTARITDEVKNAYDLEDRALFDTQLPSNGKSPEDAPVTFSTTVGRRDIDTNGHVNNIHYLEYALEALPEDVYRQLPDTVDVVFRRQILLGTVIQCIYSVTEDGRHQVEIRSVADGKIIHHAFVWFYHSLPGALPLDPTAF